MFTITHNVINTFFDAQILKGFKKFNYMRNNGDRFMV